MPTPSSITTFVAVSRVKRGISELMISASVSGTSAPVTVLGPVTSSRSTFGSPDGTWIASFLTFSRTSTVLSLTPGILASTLRTPSIFTQETAAPVTIESRDRKSTRLNSSHLGISYAVFCLKKKKKKVTKNTHTDITLNSRHRNRQQLKYAI